MAIWMPWTKLHGECKSFKQVSSKHSKIQSENMRDQTGFMKCDLEFSSNWLRIFWFTMIWHFSRNYYVFWWSNSTMLAWTSTHPKDRLVKNSKIWHNWMCICGNFFFVKSISKPIWRIFFSILGSCCSNLVLDNGKICWIRSDHSKDFNQSWSWPIWIFTNFH